MPTRPKRQHPTKLWSNAACFPSVAFAVSRWKVIAHTDRGKSGDLREGSRAGGPEGATCAKGGREGERGPKDRVSANAINVCSTCIYFLWNLRPALKIASAGSLRCIRAPPCGKRVLTCRIACTHMPCAMPSASPIPRIPRPGKPLVPPHRFLLDANFPGISQGPPWANLPRTRNIAQTPSMLH